MKKSLFLLVSSCIWLVSCQKKEDFKVVEIPLNSGQNTSFEKRLNLTLGQYPSYSTVLPDFLQTLGLQPAPVENAKATLGRVLFYDKNLSADGQISCASCHKQAFAFSDNVAFGAGVFGRKTTRNTPPLGNTTCVSAHYASIKGKSAPHFFWDNRAVTVSEQSKQTIQSYLEMDMPLDEAATRIGGLAYYEPLWNAVFGHFSPKKEEILESLESFVGSMGAANSKLDKVMEANVATTLGTLTTVSDTAIVHLYYGTVGQTDTIVTETTTVSPLAGFTDLENRGRELFVKNCTRCHSPLRSAQEVFEACIGLDEIYADPGVGLLSGDYSKNGVFKVPSLRNVELTAPYMHDGRFKTLEEVIDFYYIGIQPNPNLHPILKQSNFAPTGTDRAALVAFLKTLTDRKITTDVRFSDPFKN